MIDRVGQQLGNYRVLRSLGSGGFADVYLGEHIYLNSQAAIKILKTQLTQNDLQVFLSEARTIVNLTNRNIVQVLEFGVEQGTPFLVMTYAPNGTLRHRHPAGSRLSTSEVVSYIKQVSDALQYAHERRVIHRDIKPDNMLVGQNGDILLSDFGIAVVAQSSRYSGNQEVGGTAAYMAPEQLQGRAGPASDQYALAVTAYEWITGERPFNGSFAEICSQHLLTPPTPLRQKVPSLPPAVEQVILIALNKNPQQRFPSVEAFANALAQASGIQQGSIAPAAFNNATRREEQISTVIKQPTPSPNPALSGSPLGSFSGYNAPQSQQPFGASQPQSQQPFGPPQPQAQQSFGASQPQLSFDASQPQQPFNTPQAQSWNSPVPPPPPYASMQPNNGNPISASFPQSTLQPNNGNLNTIPYSAMQPNNGSPSTIPFSQSTMQPNYGNPATASFPQTAMAPGQFPPQGPNFPSGPGKKPSNKGKMFAIIALVVLLVIAASAGTAYFLGKKSSSTGTGQTASTTATSQPGGQATVAATATLATGQTPSTTATSPTGDSTTPTTVPTTAPAGSYAAVQPGPGCDTNGGTWTPQGLSNITCGTQVAVSSANTLGFLYLQLPNNTAFSSNNTIGVISNPGVPNGWKQCVGLAEQGTNSGFLVQYCGDGEWSIESISSNGVIVQTLDKNITSTRTNVDISLTLSGSTLSFSIDNEVHKINVSPIKPSKVAITYICNTGGYSLTINNFSYTIL